MTEIQFQDLYNLVFAIGCLNSFGTGLLISLRLI